MGHVTYADAIAIYQLIYYSPCFFASIFVAARHGVTKSSGWIFLTIFCIVRIVGASARIATITQPSSDTAYTVALVCSVLALSPLLMASLGLISRAYYSMLKQPWNMIISFGLVKVVHTPAVVALILCIVGAVNATSPAKIYSESTVHIGIILFTVVLAMLTGLTMGAYLTKRKTGQGEGLLVLAVMCALPFLFVRLLYALLAAFSHSKIFSPVTSSTGSETAALFMSVLEEMVVVMIYLATGLKLPVVPAGVADTAGGTIGYRVGRGDFGTGKLGILFFGAAVAQALRARPGEEIQQASGSGDQPNMVERGQIHHQR